MEFSGTSDKFVLNLEKTEIDALCSAIIRWTDLSQEPSNYDSTLLYLLAKLTGCESKSVIMTLDRGGVVDVILRALESYYKSGEVIIESLNTMAKEHDDIELRETIMKDSTLKKNLGATVVAKELYINLQVAIDHSINPIPEWVPADWEQQD